MITVQQLIELLESAGLVSKNDVLTVRSQVTVLDDDRESVREFVGELRKRSLLTDYQADTLREGSADQLVIGTYVLLDRIGRGGMGQVFRARHVLMKRDVAIKFVLTPSEYSGDAVWRFKREVEAAAKLEHPRIVRALDAGQRDGTMYLVMEYVPGMNLRQLVRNSGTTSVSQAMRYVRQAAEGLRYAHGQGVVHRDIKPSNILLNPVTDEIKILDMGLASLKSGLISGEEFDSRETRSEETSFGQVLGTLDYMAPEQFRDAKHAGPQADIYSLGCTLHYLLIGRPPFATTGHAAKEVMERRIPDLRSQRRDVPTAAYQVYARMLAADLNDRYSDAAALLDDLEEIAPVVGESLTATNTMAASTIELKDGVVSSSIRNRFLWITITSVLCTAAAFWWFGVRRPGFEDLDGRPDAQVVEGQSEETEQLLFPLDLLTVVDPQRDVLSGSGWSVDDDALFTGRGQATRIQIPQSVPASYRLSTWVERITGDGPLAFGLVIDDHHCYVLIDRKGAWGIGVDHSDKVVSATGDLSLEVGRRYEIVFEVRRGSIRVLLDDIETLHWRGDFSELRLGQGWRPPKKLYLFVGTNNDARFRIESLIIDPISS